MASKGNPHPCLTPPNKVDLTLPKHGLSHTTTYLRGQSLKIPLGDSTYQYVEFIGSDADGVATVKTRGGRYKVVFENLLREV